MGIASPRIRNRICGSSYRIAARNTAHRSLPNRQEEIQEFPQYSFVALDELGVHANGKLPGIDAGPGIHQEVAADEEQLPPDGSKFDHAQNIVRQPALELRTNVMGECEQTAKRMTSVFLPSA